MPRTTGDTREEIKVAALELFNTQGFEQTSLREIAERLGLTKAALYYHFHSKNDLVVELVNPLVSDLEALAHAAPSTPPRVVLESYYDLCHRHRALFKLMMTSLPVLTALGVTATSLRWRSELERRLGGPGEIGRVRGIIAVRGIQDCASQQPEGPAGHCLRAPAIDAAMRALTVP